MDYNFWKIIKEFILGHRTLLSFVAICIGLLLWWVISTGAGGIVEAISGEIWNSAFLATPIQLRYILLIIGLVFFFALIIGFSIGRIFIPSEKDKPIQLNTDGFISDVKVISASVLEGELWKYHQGDLELDDYVTYIINGLNQGHIRLGDARRYLHEVDRDVQELNRKYVLSPRK